jgi:hypothetical protein
VLGDQGNDLVTLVAPSGCGSGSTRTLPVKYSAGPLTEGCEPVRFISMASNLSFYGQSRGLRPIACINVRSTNGANLYPGVAMGSA